MKTKSPYNAAHKSLDHLKNYCVPSPRASLLKSASRKIVFPILLKSMYFTRQVVFFGRAFIWPSTAIKTPFYPILRSVCMAEFFCLIACEKFKFLRTGFGWIDNKKWYKYRTRASLFKFSDERKQEYFLLWPYIKNSNKSISQSLLLLSNNLRTLAMQISKISNHFFTYFHVRHCT